MSGREYPQSNNVKRFYHHDNREVKLEPCALILYQFIIFDPCVAELFVFISHSFEAGIANAISSFKWRKIFLFMKNRRHPRWIIWLTEHPFRTILSISVAFILVQHLLETVCIRSRQLKGHFSIFIREPLADNTFPGRSSCYLGWSQGWRTINPCLA